jgi:hypothetical protein
LAELCLTILCAILLAPARRPPPASAPAHCRSDDRQPPADGGLRRPRAALHLTYHRRQTIAFAALPALIGVAVIATNCSVFSTSPAGAADSTLWWADPGRPCRIVIGPNRGLLVYTPIMLFAVWGAVRVWRVDAPVWLRWLSIGVALHVLVYAKFQEWWAGYTYGPRYFTDVLPALTIFLVYGLVPLCRAPAMRAAVAALAVYGAAVQAIGVYAADDSWERTPVPLEAQPERVWDGHDLQIVRALHNGWHGGQFAALMFDAFLDPVPAQIKPLTEAVWRAPSTRAAYPPRCGAARPQPGLRRSPIAARWRGPPSTAKGDQRGISPFCWCDGWRTIGRSRAWATLPMP